MSFKLQEVVRLGGHILPDILSLFTSLLRKQVLQILREHAVINLNLVTEKNRCIPRIMTTFNKGQGTSQNLLVDSHHSSSNAEKII